MDEMEEETKEEVPEPQKEEPEDKSLSVIEKAEAAADRNQKILDEMKIENDRKEAMMAKTALSGKAEAGGTAEKKEETPKEYADRVMANDLE